MGSFFGGFILGRFIFWGSFALKNGSAQLYVEGIFPLKISQDFASENTAPEGMWVRRGGIELPYKLTICIRSKEIQAQCKEWNSTVKR